MSARHRLLAGALTGVMTVASLGLLSGCGRSVEAYCDTVAKHKERYLGAMKSAQGADGLEGLLGATLAVTDLQSMWTEMAKTAPEDIRSDTEAVRDNWEKVTDAALKQDWMVAVATALAGSDPMKRVDIYVAQHCGAEYSFTGVGARAVEASPSAQASQSPGPSPSSSGSTSASSSKWESAASTTLGELSETGWRRTDATIYTCDGSSSSEGIFSGWVLDPVGGGFTALPTPELPSGEEIESSDCVVTGSAASLRVVYLVKSKTPASGLDPAKTHRRLYSIPIQSADKPVVKKSPIKWDVGGLRSTGKTVIVSGAGQSTDMVAALDATTGDLLWQEKESASVSGLAAGVIAISDTYEGMRLANARTGRTLATVRSSSNFVELESGLAGTVNDENYSGKYNVLLTGSKLRRVDRPVSQQFGERLLLHDDKGFEVVKSDSLKVLLKRTGKAYRSLDSPRFAIAGNYLYMVTDEGSSVINVTYGTKVADSWFSRATDRLTSGWTVVVDGESDRLKSASCFEMQALTCNASSVQVVKDVDGQYPGPWF